jgi:PAS domain S-box-containing protein
VNNNKQIQQLSDLNGKRIALLNGSVQQNNFRQMMKGFDYQYTEILANSLHETLSLVRIDIADAAITNHFFGDLNAPNYELQKTPIILNPENLFFAVRPSSDTSIINTIDLYLKVWRNTPQSFYYITLQQYTHSEPPTPFINPVKIILFLLAVSIIILLVAVLYSKQRTIRKLLKQMTDNKRLIQHEEDKFRSYFESSPIGLFVADTQGRYIDVNPSACQITGYKAQELKSLTIADLIPESGRKAAGNHFNQLKTEGRAKASMPFQTRSGEIRHWTVNAVKIEEDKLIGFVEDITERMKMDIERSQLPKALEKKVKEKTQELSLRISELEHFREVTIERELRMEELRTEIKRLKKK